MNVLILGATGMVGQGVLRECLLDEGVARVVTLGRSPTGQSHRKLREIVHGNLLNLRPIESQLTGLDACFYCLGASATGLSEADYTQINYVLTLSVAETLARIDPDMTFIYVSGAGTDSSERGRSMWARVKGRTENALLRLPFKAAYMLRPGVIIPMHGIKSKTRLYRAFYMVLDGARTVAATDEEAVSTWDHHHGAARTRDVATGALRILDACTGDGRSRDAERMSGAAASARA